jgi:hypothetical protein
MLIKRMVFFNFFAKSNFLPRKMAKRATEGGIQLLSKRLPKPPDSAQWQAGSVIFSRTKTAIMNRRLTGAVVFSSEEHLLQASADAAKPRSVHFFSGLAARDFST